MLIKEIIFNKDDKDSLSFFLFLYPFSFVFQHSTNNLLLIFHSLLSKPI